MKRYSGIKLNPVGGASSDIMVTVHEQFEGRKFLPIGDLKHRIYHSPSGFNWGYAGSGPADLARSILWDHLGKEPPHVLYMAFKEQFVAGWKDEWEINSREIQSWIKGKIHCTKKIY